jgi:hypothetical protein
MITTHVAGIFVAAVAATLLVVAAVAVTTGHEHIAAASIATGAVVAAIAGLITATESARRYRRTYRR